MSELRRVMCVEDDEDIRMILDFSLGSLGGYELLCCPGGAEALSQGPAFRPDLILLDVMMPHLSGPETLERFRQHDGLRHVPVVFMTAKAMHEEVVDLLQYGATGIIVKPFDPMTLPSDIRVYWEHGRGNKQP